MDSSTLTNTIAAAGMMHFFQLPAMLFFNRHVLDFQGELQRLSEVMRRVVQVLGAAIVVTVLGTGALVLFAREELAHRGRLSLGLLAFLCLFWGLRAACQGWYAAVWPLHQLAGKLSHLVLMLIFTVQAWLYGSAAAALW